MRHRLPGRVVRDPRSFALVLMVLCALPAAAQTLHGKVVSVDTGDAVSLLDSTAHRHRIRLTAIAAPDRDQPFASASREHLAHWLDQREVIVEQQRTTGDGALLGTVFIDGHDVNLEQVRAGFCWWDPQTGAAQTAEEREVYRLAEEAARYRKLGLWSDPDPVPPWIWREKRRMEQTR